MMSSPARRGLPVRIRPAVALAACLLPAVASASCGASSCAFNTQWEVQGHFDTPGLRLDLRQEFIDQDQLRLRTDKVGVGEVPAHHDELRTLNRNTLLGLDYGGEGWGVTLTLPWVNRDHSHLHHHMGTDLVEAWDLEGAGDARLLGRLATGTGTLQVLGGLKLPTGAFAEVNGDGDEAERSLQPGTGTTDLLLGLAWSARLPQRGLSGFVQGLWQAPLAARQDYRPGYQLGIDAGLRQALGARVSVMAQLNAQLRGRDAGGAAEPEESGGRWLFLSPGMSVQLGAGTQAYAFLQQPLLQRVNGLQLTADQAWSVGVSHRF